MVVEGMVRKAIAVTACVGLALAGSSTRSAQAKSNVESSPSSSSRGADESDVQGGDYHWVRNFVNNQCLAVAGGGGAGTRLITWDCSQQWGDHYWRFENLGGDLRRIHPLHTPSNCIAIPQGSYSDRQLIIWPCTPQFNDHVWRLVFHGNRFDDPNLPIFEIRNAVTGKCIDTDRLEKDAQVWQRPCDGSGSQWWIVDYRS
jgi:hypothetical protein